MYESIMLKPSRPKEYTLNVWSQFVSPRMWSDVGSHKRDIVVEDGFVKVGEYKFAFRKSEQLKDGTSVVFWMGNRSASCMIKSQHDHWQDEIQSYYQKLDDNRKQLGIRKRLDANQFYQSYEFPMKFIVGVKEVMSGLTENSNGCGTKANTVFHMILSEEFVSGRLKRSKGDFLCGNQMKYANWSGQNDTCYWTIDFRYGTWYVPKITCKSCLKKLEKYKINE